MDKVEFFDEESKEYIELYVLEQTRLNGADYLLVTRWMKKEIPTR